MIYIILALILIFILVLVTNAVLIKAKARKLTEKKEHKSTAEQLAYAEKLAKMIRCKTVSVEGNYDDTEFKKLRDTMKELFPLIHEKAEIKIFGDDCWLYKIEGKDTSRNIMVMSHHDVVEAQGEWKHEPFGGKIVDGAIWGRGTIDTKTPLFAEFAALEELLSEGFLPECNVYIGSSHNEELGGDGIPLALKYFEENGITFETILDEGGAIIDPPLAGMQCKCAMLAVHEKGRHRIVCTASEGTGHTGLAANTNTPTARMAAFIAEINKKNIFIRRLYPEVKAMFTDLAPYCPFVMRLLFGNLWLFGSILKAVMPKINPQAGAMIGTSCTFNEIEGSYKAKQCVAKAMLRCVNDDDLKQDMEKINEIAAKYGIEVKNGEGCEYHRPADMTKPQFAYTKKCIGEIFPDVAAAAYILPAGTDARHLSDICRCVIRFAPIAMDSEQFKTVHSENENIAIEAVANAVVFYKHYLKNYK